MSDYVLMHKNTAVVRVDVDEDTGLIRKVGELAAKEHLPVGVPARRGNVDRAALNEWWADRSIPAQRSGIERAMEALGVRTRYALALSCYGLSLSDQYWIRPEEEDVQWEKVNFFDNPFSEDVGDILFGAERKEDALDLSSPDNTSDGNLKKRWKILGGKRCLVKGGSNPFRQQPLNEVIAARIMDCLGIAHIPYTVYWEKGAPYSICEDFVTRDTELIPAWRIFRIEKKPNNISVYQHFVQCAEASGLPDVVPFLDRMIVLDYIIANEDRHFNNFGALRNAETLEWAGMAPIYDSGSSLGYDKTALDIRREKGIVCKPFKKHHRDQLGLVTDFSWIRFDRLEGVRDMILETLSDKQAAEYLDERRILAIADTTARRIREIEALASTHRKGGSDTTEGDLEKNTAAAYGGALGPYEEFDWGEGIGIERWVHEED